jgi:glycosyltransferase involved in cell wall biosynthesis
VQRWLKFAKYLPKNGWQPVVFTPENPAFDVTDKSLFSDIPPEAEVVKIPILEPYRLLGTGRAKKSASTNFGVLPGSAKGGWKQTLLRWVRGNIMVPDPRVFWVQPSLRYLLRYLKAHPVDAIVTTGPPHSMHLIGLALKKATDTPWIADFRDPWSKLDLLDDYHIIPAVRRRYERMEAEVLSHCDACLSVSKVWGEMYTALGAKKVAVITNGYEEKDVISKESIPTEKFILSHFGLLNHLRNPLVLWETLERKMEADSSFAKDFELHLGGNIDPVVLQTLYTYPLIQERLKLFDYVSHSALPELYAKSSVLLLMCFNSDIGRGNIPGKLFEYLAAEKPILAFGRNGGDVDRILGETSGGKLFDYSAEGEVVSDYIHQLYSKYKTGSEFLAETAEIRKYQREKLTEDLVGLLNKTIT